LFPSTPLSRSEDAVLSRESPYRYRRRYYSDWGYYPWWWGTYDPYYNDYGYRYFDDDDDDDAGVFGDSSPAAVGADGDVSALARRDGRVVRPDRAVAARCRDHGGRRASGAA